MPQNQFASFRSIFAALVIMLAATNASAQDAEKIATDAEKQIADIQKLLVKGKDTADKDNPLLKQLRVDGFKAVDGKVHVSGLFIDPGVKANGDVESQVGGTAKDLILKHLGVDKQVLFVWKETAIVGGIDDKGDPVGEAAPHVVLQYAANAAGARGDAAADQVRFDSSYFNADGGLIITGVRGKDAGNEKWVSDLISSRLVKHPAAQKGKPKITSDVKATEWKTSAAVIQGIFAAAGKRDGTEQERNQFALRRLLVERAYFTYEGGGLRFRVEGLRMGEAAVQEDALDEVLEPIVLKTAGKKVPLDKSKLLSNVLEEPLTQLRGAVADTPVLDGVRIDPGFTFGSSGELTLAGIQPGLNDDARKSLESLVQSNFLAFGKGKPLATKYALVAKHPVSVSAMTVLPLDKVMTDLRAWAVRTKDDLKLQRLYFPDNFDPLKKKYYAEVSGLTLLYRPMNAADVKDVESEFKRLLTVHIEKGIPASEVAIKVTSPDAERETLLPGLTAFLRKEMAGDQKKWNGALLERGHFDEKGRYTLAGVADSAEQSKLLAKLLEELKADPKWDEYLSSYAAPDLTVIPMAELLDRVKRVTLAYSTFDGLRIESARYDANVNLIFEAHVVGQQVNRDVATLLAKLLRDHPTYGRRAPVGKQVQVTRINDSATADKPPANFSLAKGAQLLSKMNDSKEDKQKAKEWIDTAILHYPNESTVWFFSAYYNHAVEKDEELTRRDLYRMVELEGQVSTTQRKRRYEAAQDLQGAVRSKVEDIAVECFREVKEGAKPITLKKK